MINQSQNTILIQSIIESEFRNLKTIINNKTNKINKKRNYCYYYKQFEKNAKIYERIAHHYKNKNDLKLSYNLFELSSLLYYESAVLREQCNLLYYNNDILIKNDISHIEAYNDCIKKYERCTKNKKKLLHNLEINNS